MASIKLHVFRGDNDGSTSCDYRGDLYIGAEQGDHHRTVAEIDPASEGQVDEALTTGPLVNALFVRLAASQPDFGGNIATLLGLEGDGPVGLRIGVWDE